MKTTVTIIILFLSMNLMGQGIDPKIEAYIDSIEWTFIDADQFNETPPFSEKDYINAKVDKRIIELWKEYRVECLSDTGSFMWHDYEYFTTQTREHMVIYKREDGRWFYHKKPTLEGFMQFIERKITKNK